MEIKVLMNKESDPPVRSQLMAWEEFVELSGCPGEVVAELLEMGWIRVAQSANQADLYSHTDVYRLRKLQRICKDLDVPTLGGTIIVDLVNQVIELERQVQELQAAIARK
ncbi:chaperone modulator CbpM [Desulfovibrio sp. OttesenSCG-928-C06]|nr:chaperone modulator CbpM [Desulfovibrio sp. OttesenSCG-928-C06]